MCRSPDVLGRLVSSSLHLEMILLCLDLLGSHVFGFFVITITKVVTAWSYFCKQIHVSAFPDELLLLLF